MEKIDNENGLLFKEESYKIIGTAMEVHRVLGCGFIEPVYQEALEKEFVLNNIPYEREKELTIDYKGSLLTKTFRADFICYDKIILELKAVSQFQQHEAWHPYQLRQNQSRILPYTRQQEMATPKTIRIIRH